VSEISPFLKWVGGKRWITARYDWLLPDTYNAYIEPFLGGGAVLFHMKPSTGVLGDVNADLIACYAAIKSNWRLIQQLLEEHQRKHCSEYYYSIRGNRFSGKIEEAARFLYLNRACFNGIYRVNLMGQFNVPKGSKEAIVLEDDDFRAVSQVLKRCRLVNQDFAKTLALAKCGDFVFVDPPYT
jgi:DNA adenine methylase